MEVELIVLITLVIIKQVINTLVISIQAIIMVLINRLLMVMVMELIHI